MRATTSPTGSTAASHCTQDCSTSASSTPTARSTCTVRCPPRLDSLLAAVEPFRDGLVIAAECTYTRYWLADLCAREEIPSCSATPST